MTTNSCTSSGVSAASFTFAGDEDDLGIAEFSLGVVESLQHFLSKQYSAGGGCSSTERPKSASIHGRTTKSFDLAAFLKEETLGERACHLELGKVSVAAIKAESVGAVFFEDAKSFYERQEDELEALVQATRAHEALARTRSEEEVVQSMYKDALSSATTLQLHLINLEIAIEKSPHNESLLEEHAEITTCFLESFERFQAVLSTAISIGLVERIELTPEEEALDPTPFLVTQAHDLIYLNTVLHVLTEEKQLKEQYEAVLEELFKDPFLEDLLEKKRALEFQLSKLIEALGNLIIKAEEIELSLEKFTIESHLYKKLHDFSIDKIKTTHIDLILTEIDHLADLANESILEKLDFLKAVHAAQIQKGINFFKKASKAAVLHEALEEELTEAEIQQHYEEILFKAIIQELVEIGKKNTSQIVGINTKLEKSPAHPGYILEKARIEAMIAKIIKAGVQVMDLCHARKINLAEFGLEDLELEALDIPVHQGPLVPGDLEGVD